jgi:hypothetical protein
MEEALRFFKANEPWIYLLLGLGGLLFAARFLRAWNELRQSAFGLERESAQARVNQAASVLVLLFVVAVVEFAIVSFVVPAVPGANPLLTPTLDLLSTPLQPLDSEIAETPQPGLTPVAPLDVGLGEGCVPDMVMLLSPVSGETIQGTVPITGTANAPNFGFYKFEMARPNEQNWLSIQAGNNIVQEDWLGNWDTARLSPGIYWLRLVVTDNQGQSLPPCTIEVNVIPP